MVKLFLEEVAKKLGVAGTYMGTALGYRFDSRKVQAGDLFFALKGERVDGHEYLEQVAAKGAVAAVVSKEYGGPNFGLELLCVDDVKEALQELARCVQADCGGRIIGVTGSVGKTTTKEFICTLLEGEYRVAKTEGNANSQVGLPLGILNREGEYDFFVFEMGMSEAGEIRRLVTIAPPEIAVITAVGVSHAEFFADGIEGVARAKSEIFSQRATRLVFLGESAAKFSVCKSAKCETVCYSAVKGWQLPFKESHLVANAWGAIAVAKACGMTDAQIQERVGLLSASSGRFQRVEKDGVLFINDAYNASPDSMRAAFENLPEPKSGGKRIAVLGSMKELGQYEKESHREIQALALKSVDHLLCLGKEWEAASFASLEEVEASLQKLITPGDVVLLKGSNSHQLWKLLRIPK